MPEASVIRKLRSTPRALNLRALQQPPVAERRAGGSGNLPQNIKKTVIQEMKAIQRPSSFKALRP
jgi:hypothetical protein